MIEFESIKFKNFLSYGNYWTQIDLKKHGTTIIWGENGRGKSSFLDALCFALFGKPFRSIKKTALVNSINKKDCQVEVTFRTGGKLYRILRGISPNLFEIYQDEVLINQTATTKDYQDILERGILKFNYKSFTQIVILGAASYTPFMQLSAADRRAFIEDLLDIQVFSVMGDIVKELVSKNKDSISQERNTINLLEQKYTLEKKHLESIQKADQGRLEALKVEYKQTMENYKSLEGSIKSLEDDIRESIKKIPDKKVSQDQLNQLIGYRASIESKVKTLRGDIKFYQDNEKCSTCKQPIDGTFKDFEIKKMEEETKRLSDGLVIIAQRIKDTSQILQGIDKQLSEVQLKNIQVSSIKGQLRGEENNLRKLLSQIKEEEKPKEDSSKILEGILDELGERNRILEGYLNEKTYQDAAINLLKDGGIKSKIIKQYLPIINSEITHYLTKLDFYVNFSLDETFKETIQTRHKEDFSYSNFSEGEKARINLSILLAWRSIARKINSANTNLLVLDEVFDSSMDYSGIENLIGILQGMENCNIFIISHKGDILTDKFDRTLQVTKTKNFSRIKGN